MTRTYLDHAATTPLTAAARAVLADALGRWANPSSPHAEGRAARAALEGARGRLATALGWNGTLVFTSGATEAAALALGRTARPVLVAATDHAAVLGARADATLLPVDASGMIELAALEEALAATPGAMVAVQQVNSETGVRQPLTEVAALVTAGRGRLFVDAAQGAGKLPLPVADLVAISGHKLGGPPGIGALLVRDLADLVPHGQGQERGYRPGTENLPGALAYAAAAEEDCGWVEPCGPWRAGLEATIVAEGGEVIGGSSPRSPLIGAYAMPEMSAAAQLMRLDALGFAVSAGSACSSGSMRPSHVLAAMGVPGEVAARTIRVSFGRTTTADEVHRFATGWVRLAHEARARAA